MATPAVPQPQTLADRIRAKYPGAYDDMDNSTLEIKVLQKYPQYADMPRSAPTPIPAQPEPSMWHNIMSAFGSDFKVSANPYGTAPLPGRAAAAAQFGEQADKDMAAEDAYRKSAGYSKSYRALAPVAEGLGANVVGMEQAAQQGNVGAVIGHAATVPAQMAATAGIAHGLPFLRDMLPSKARAGANFQTVMGAAKDVPIDTTAPGNTALEIKQMADSGGSMPKVVRDFVRRATDPTKGPITYEEGRQFQQNASRLSVDEYNRLNPNLKRMIGQFSRDLNNANTGAAGQVGQADTFEGAMKEYASRSSINKGANVAAKYLTRQALEKLPWVGAVYAGKKIVDATK